MLEGIDFSHWQGKAGRIDWDRVARSGDFFILNATDGMFHLDPLFLEAWDELSRRGKVLGAYHLLKLVEPVQAQIEWFAEAVRGRLRPGCLPPFCDIETSKIDEVLDQDGDHREEAYQTIMAFLEGLGEAFGVDPIIYISRRGVRHLSPWYAGLSRYKLWIMYRSMTAEVPLLPTTFTEWDFWQYTSDGDGKGKGFESVGLDLNRFNGTWQQLGKLCNSWRVGRQIMLRKAVDSCLTKTEQLRGELLFLKDEIKR